MNFQIFPSETHFSSFDQYFQHLNEQEFSVYPSSGNGSVRIHKVEEGLTAHSWNVRFLEDARVSDKGQVPDSKFILAFVSEGKGLQLCNRDFWLQKNDSWNVILAESSNFWFHFSAVTSYRFLIIYLTKSWVYKNIFKSNTAFFCKGQACFKNEIVLLGSMNAQEMKTVLTIYESSWKNSLGTLYIKSIILTLINDFFVRINSIGTPLT